VLERTEQIPVAVTELKKARKKRNLCRLKKKKIFGHSGRTVGFCVDPQPDVVWVTASIGHDPGSQTAPTDLKPNNVRFQTGKVLPAQHSF
jgi:hypothetical protein